MRFEDLQQFHGLRLGLCNSLREMESIRPETQGACSTEPQAMSPSSRAGALSLYVVDCRRCYAMTLAVSPASSDAKASGMPSRRAEAGGLGKERF